MPLLCIVKSQKKMERQIYIYTIFKKKNEMGRVKIKKRIVDNTSFRNKNALIQLYKVYMAPLFFFHFNIFSISVKVKTLPRCLVIYNIASGSPPPPQKKKTLEISVFLVISK